MQDKTIGALGTGNMGEAMINGFIKGNVVERSQVVAFDCDRAKLEQVAKTLEVKTAASNREVIDQADIVFVAVKPQDLGDLLDDIREMGVDLDDKIFVSVAAGISIGFFKQKLGPEVKVVRLMPNTPCLVEAGVIALSGDDKVTSEDKTLIKSLLTPTAEVFEVQEEYMNAVTGLSGSGPAYVFLMMEAMSHGGMKMGLSQAQSLTMAAQVMQGAAKMVLETGEHPAVLKDKVSSPAGTTINALQVLEDAGVRGALMRAVETAANRAETMSKEEN